MPLSVCIDCCVLLNQCSEFFEKTNQAQTSLRQLLIEPKSEPSTLEPTIDFIKKTVEFPKEEEIAIDECQLSNNYIHNSAVDIANTYFSNENENDCNEQKYETVKEEKCKIQVKKGSPKQAKKKVKKKSQMQRMEDLELCLNSDLKKGHNDIGIKSNVKVPDNYMTGKIYIIFILDI